jgi:hypothetical protein
LCDPPEIAGALLAELRREIATDVAFTRSPEPLSGGHSAELFAFAIDRPPGEMVLRLPGDMAAAEREARVHQHVSVLGYPAPSVVLAGGAESSFDRPFSCWFAFPVAPRR